MRLKLILAVAIVGGFTSLALAGDDDFPPYSRPTNFDQSPIDQMRSGAADTLRASGFKANANQLRSPRIRVPYFNDVLGTSDYTTLNQRVIFLAPSGKMILVGE